MGKQFVGWLLSWSAVLVMVSLLGACGGSGGGGGGKAEPPVPPNRYSLRLVSPTANANLRGGIEQINVVGLLVDNSTGELAQEHDIKTLRIGGVEAVFDSERPYAWKAEAVPLDPRQLYPRVSAAWDRGNGRTERSALPFQNQYMLRYGGDMALDYANNRLLVETNSAVIGVDLGNGHRRPFIGDEAGQGPVFSQISGLSVEPQSHSLWLSSLNTDSLWKIDLSSGEAVVVSDSTNGSGMMFSAPGEVVADYANGRVLVVDTGTVGEETAAGAVFSVDALTGDRTLLTAASIGSGESLVTPGELQYDAQRNELIMSRTYTQNLLSVDLETGLRSLHGEPLGSAPNAIQFDKANDRTLVQVNKKLLAVDRESGLISVLYSNNVGAGPLVTSATSLVVNSQGNTAWMLDSDTNAIIKVDLLSGNRSVLSASRVGKGGEMLVPEAVAFDRETNQAYLATNQSSIRGYLYRVDMSTGNRTPVVGDGTGFGVFVGAIGGLALDAENRVLYMSARVDQFYNWGIVKMDLETGERTMVSSSGYNVERGAGIDLDYPRGVVIDAANNRLLVADASLRALFAVDLETGDRTVISASSLPDDNLAVGTGEQMVNPEWLALDADNNRVLLTRSNPTDVVLAVDLNTGSRTVLSGQSDLTQITSGAGSPLYSPSSIVLDKESNRALVMVSKGVIAVDLQSGDRSDVLHYPQTREGAVLLEDYPLILAANVNHLALEMLNLEDQTSVIVAQ